jgi:hypothetical protein
MPAINLTNNTDLNLTASSGDDNATLNRYLTSLLTFKTPPGFDAIAGLRVTGLDESVFPITPSATGEAKFAVEKAALDVQLGASACVGFLKGSDAQDFLSSVKANRDDSSSGLVSFGLKGTLSAGVSGGLSDFTFGIADKATVTVTSYYAAGANDTLGNAVARAASGLTIPRDLEDLKSLPEGAISQIDAASCLKFMASVKYSFLNDPLAAVSLGKLPSFAIKAEASATLEGHAAHTSDHTLTIAKLPGGLIHLSVGLKKIDDFETSLTVSAGVGASIGSEDPLAFLLDKINPSSVKETDEIAKQMKDAARFKSDLKSAIDAALSASLAASFQAALDKSKTRGRAFLFEIDLNGLDNDSRLALQAALAGDFTAITKSEAEFKGIKQLDSVLTVSAADKHTLALHFLGIFNAASIHEFIAKSKIDFTRDTHEIVFSDERLQVVDNNLDAEKLRKLVLKDITLTLPASANTKDGTTLINVAYFDREGSTGRSKMRQFVNVLQHVQAPSAGQAQALLTGGLKHYGVCTLFLDLSLDPTQCRRLFVDAKGKGRDWVFYIGEICDAEKTILAGLDGDPESAYRWRLFNAHQETWKSLQEAGTGSNMTPTLRKLGMTDTEAKLAVADALTAVWWAEAMASYAAALAKGKPPESAGKELVEDSNRGYNEPWMALAAWNIAGRPAIRSAFQSSLVVGAAAAG